MSEDAFSRRNKTARVLLRAVCTASVSNRLRRGSVDSVRVHVAGVRGPHVLRSGAFERDWTLAVIPGVCPDVVSGGGDLVGAGDDPVLDARLHFDTRRVFHSDETAAGS